MCVTTGVLLGLQMQKLRPKEVQRLAQVGGALRGRPGAVLTGLVLLERGLFLPAFSLLIGLGSKMERPRCQEPQALDGGCWG